MEYVTWYMFVIMFVVILFILCLYMCGNGELSFLFVVGYVRLSV